MNWDCSQIGALDGFQRSGIEFEEISMAPEVQLCCGKGWPTVLICNRYIERVPRMDGKLSTTRNTSRCSVKRHRPHASQ